MAEKSKTLAFWQDIHIRETFRGGGIFLIIKVLGSLGAYLFAWYISRIYGPEGNGIMAFTLTLAVLLAALYNLGLNIYAVKIIPQYRYQNDIQGTHSFYRNALSTVVKMTLAGSAILIAITYIIPSGTLSRDLFLVSFLTIPVSLLLFISHTFKARKNILSYSLLQNNIVQVAALLILILPVWARMTPSEPVWACVWAGMAMTIVGLIANNTEKHPKATLQSLPFSSHLRESLPMLAGGLAFMILNLTDRIMLRFLDSTAQLGIYDIALRLSNLSLLGILSLNAIAEPKFAEFFAQNAMGQLRQFVKRMTLIGLLIAIPVIGVLGLFSDFWLGFFGKEGDFLSGRASLYILLLGQLISVACGAVLILLNMTGHQRSVQTILITAALLNVILNAILIPRWGIAGAAWATTIGTILWSLWALLTVRKKLGFWMWG